MMLTHRNVSAASPRAPVAPDSGYDPIHPMPEAVPEAFRGLERIPTEVFTSQKDACSYVARRIADIIRQKSENRQRAVLGFVSGTSPVGVYAELVRMHKEEGLSFSNVWVFNVDEFFPISEASPQGYGRQLRERLLRHVDIPENQINLLNGNMPVENVRRYCEEYEQAIVAAGGLDFLLLGMSGAGHLGYNEPHSGFSSATRLLYLGPQTRAGVSPAFFGLDNVPRQALTMGMATILSATEIMLLAFTETKADIVARVVEGPASVEVPATALQDHCRATVICDLPAGTQLSRVVCPWWAARHCSFLEFDSSLERKAVIWLALRVKKPLLKLLEADYAAHSLQSLVDRRGPAHRINIRVFKYMQSTVTDWPAGKPPSPEALITCAAKRHRNAPGASPRPQLNLADTAALHSGGDFDAAVTEWPRRVLIFSPHPDDDVISMGGTFLRLVDQGHEVHICYQTSGNNAVWDDEVRRYTWFVAEFIRALLPEASLTSPGSVNSATSPSLEKSVSTVLGLCGSQEEVEDDDVLGKSRMMNRGIDKFLLGRSPGAPPTASILRIKALIRYSEARAAAQYCGVPDERIHFLEMPFYETGASKKKPLGPDDVKAVKDLLETVRPHQVYCAGDLTDPHGTHRTCLRAILMALMEVEKEGQDWLNDCVVWMYRGAWQEWELERVEMAVPMSPQEMELKRFAIFKHQSQKDPAPFPGGDDREFWQRSEARNRQTASLYDTLGLPEYEGLEAFVQLRLSDQPLVNELLN